MRVELRRRLGFTDCDFALRFTAVGSSTATLTVEVAGGPTVSDEVHVELLPLSSDGGDGGIGGNGEVVTGTDVTYTVDEDFDLATFLNLNHDAPNHDELRLNGNLRPFPFVNIAASARGTIVRLDANTGDILGEYLTAPDGMGRNPSTNDGRSIRQRVGRQPRRVPRTGRRVQGVGGASRSRAGRYTSGREQRPDPQGGYVAAPFAYNTCLDRDGDGLIRTSSGLADILAWTNDGDADTAGGVSTAEDECIINYVRVTGSLTRTIAVDAENDVWVGGTGDLDHEKIDGDTGEPVPGTQVNFACGGYGGLIDRNQVLWSAFGCCGWTLPRWTASACRSERTV